MALARFREPIMNWGIAVGVEGTVMYAEERLLKESRKYQQVYDSLYKNLKNWTEPVLLVTISLVAYMFGERLLTGRFGDILVRVIRVTGSLGVKKALEQGLKDVPFLVVNSATEIEVFNLDPNANVVLFIDGNSVSVSVQTDANGYAKITLSTGMDTGKTHKILAHTGFKAVYDEVYVS